MKFYPNERIAMFIDGSNLYAAARALNCEILYSEDLSHGQVYGGVRVINSFVSS